jgi:hypothetical protein
MTTCQTTRRLAVEVVNGPTAVELGSRQNRAMMELCTKHIFGPSAESRDIVGNR